MTQPQRHPYRPGERVLVEGTVVSFESGKPYGAVTVRFAEATDPSFLLDGVDVVAPQAIVYAEQSVDIPFDEYVADEGFYPNEEDE